MAILFLSFKRGTTGPNKSIDIQHYKRLRRNTLTEFHSLSFHPHNLPVTSIILKNFKLLQNDSETGTIFPQLLLISFKRDKNIGKFLVRSSFQTNDQSGTFKCARSRCKTCPFIHNIQKISGPKRSIKITDHLLQWVIYWRNRKTTKWPIPRTPSRSGKKWQGRIQTSC